MSSCYIYSIFLEIELETDLPLEKLAKFVSKKCKGKILKELGDGRYLVEIEDPEGDFLEFRAF